jgi:hypothetical protein
MRSMLGRGPTRGRPHRPAPAEPGRGSRNERSVVHSGGQRIIGNRLPVERWWDLQRLRERP